MSLKLSTWLVAALAGGALTAGCGSSGSSTTSATTSTAAPATATTTATTAKPAETTPAATTPKATATTPKATATPTPATAPPPAKLPPEQQLVAACEKRSAAEASLSPGLKAKLAKLCEIAKSGNKAEQLKIAAEACEEIIHVSHVPAAYKRQALAVCKTE